jgi:hypothetical protein
MVVKFFTLYRERNPMHIIFEEFQYFCLDSESKSAYCNVSIDFIDGIGWLSASERWKMDACTFTN